MLSSWNSSYFLESKQTKNIRRTVKAAASRAWVRVSFPGPRRSRGFKMAALAKRAPHLLHVCINLKWHEEALHEILGQEDTFRKQCRGMCLIHSEPASSIDSSNIFTISFKIFPFLLANISLTRGLLSLQIRLDFDDVKASNNLYTYTRRNTKRAKDEKHRKQMLNQQRTTCTVCQNSCLFISGSANPLFQINK